VGFSLSLNSIMVFLSCIVCLLFKAFKCDSPSSVGPNLVLLVSVCSLEVGKVGSPPSLCIRRGLMLQSHAIERPEDAMKARGLIGRNLG
jgi:hypothetical protein